MIIRLVALQISTKVEAVGSLIRRTLMSLGGPERAARGWPDVDAEQTVTVDPHREHITFAPFAAPDRMSVLDVDFERVAIKTRGGRVIEERANPRESFPTALVDSHTPWDAIQACRRNSRCVR